MLTYNTHLRPLILPEYGRVVQSMVDHCLTIEDRDLRTRCAYSIIKAMKSLFQANNNDEEAERKLWDHLAIMSEFKLDIDWPYEIIRPDSINPTPDYVPYDQSDFDCRQYGRTLLTLIDAAASMDPGEERDALVALVANQMKKTSLAWDSDNASDERIFEDLAAISDGRIVIEPGSIVLCEYKDAPKPGKKKKKK